MHYIHVIPIGMLLLCYYMLTWSVNSMIVVVTSDPLGCVSTLTSVFLTAGGTISLPSLLMGWGGRWVTSVGSFFVAWIEVSSAASFLALWASAVRGAFLGTNGLREGWHSEIKIRVRRVVQVHYHHCEEAEQKEKKNLRAQEVKCTLYGHKSKHSHNRKEITEI